MLQFQFGGELQTESIFLIIKSWSFFIKNVLKIIIFTILADNRWYGHLNVTGSVNLKRIRKNRRISAKIYFTATFYKVTEQQVCSKHCYLFLQ